MVPMYRNHVVAVVVPAYNEEQHIGLVLGGLPEYVDAAYVVDDASTDGTVAIVQDWQPRDPRVCLLQHPANLGVGAAIATGYACALADGADIAAVFAGDNQMDPLELPRLLDPIIDGQADYTKGDRTSGRSNLKGMSHCGAFATGSCAGSRASPWAI